MVFLNNVLHEKLAQQSRPEAADAARLGELLEQTQRHIRQLARGLHPFPMEPKGLMSALAQLAESTAQLHRVACRFDCPHPVLVPDNDVATHLFRIAQEAVTNALRHAKGVRAITLSLREDDHTLQLFIQDNGGGMAPRQGPPTGLGLPIMRHRAEAVGATLDIVPVKPRGTRIQCCVPLARTNLPQTNQS